MIDKIRFYRKIRGEIRDESRKQESQHGGMKKEPIIKKLFRTYIFWIVICIIAILAVTVVYAGHVITRNITQTQRQLTVSINQNIENYFNEMNDFSMELVKSEDFRKKTLRELPQHFGLEENTADLFSQMYQNAYKMIQKEYSVGIVIEPDYYVWMGNEYFIDKLENGEPDTYRAYPMDGSPVVKYLERNEYLRTSMKDRQISNSESPKISLSRSFGDSSFFYNGNAILEVQIEADSFVKDILRLSSTKNGTGLKIHILNSLGESIYSETDWDAENFLDANGWKEGSFQSGGMYTYVYRLFDSNLYVLYNISFFQYYREAFISIGIALCLTLLIAAVLTAVSYQVSWNISKPLHEICQELQNVNLEKGVRFQPVETEIMELDYLSCSIRELNEKLEESLRHIVMLKEFENHSKLLALQAQMQPHFLVNTLTTMGSMAEEAGNRDIAGMCMNLTQMFRYISAEESRGVRMFEELKHVDRYVEIMRERFPNAQVEIDIPLEMMDIRIPKLIIQPLVENSFKYCNRSHPVIEVRGQVNEEGFWSVSVSDNGDGFSSEEAEKIMEKCLKSLEGVNSLSTQVDGMGLVNVYVRMQLFFRGDVLYRMDENGIVIGGKML